MRRTHLFSTSPKLRIGIKTGRTRLNVETGGDPCGGLTCTQETEVLKGEGCILLKGEVCCCPITAFPTSAKKSADPVLPFTPQETEHSSGKSQSNQENRRTQRVGDRHRALQRLWR